MPELPEVETIVNGLKPRVTGRTFTAVRVHDARPIQLAGLDDFCSGLIGRQVTDLERRGKYLVFSLSGGLNLIIHLRMTGALLWDPPGEERFTRVEFFFERGGRLVYTDVRRFGTMYLAAVAEDIVGKLGIEPLSAEFTTSRLGKLLHGRATPVKMILLNQQHIAGIGNMYADEALFAAGLHPLRPGGSLTKQEIKSLHGAIIEVLQKAIRNQGASVRDYRVADGGRGRAHEEFCVAHRRGLPCPVCGTPIERMVVGQRGTYYCPRCQRLV